MGLIVILLLTAVSIMILFVNSVSLFKACIQYNWIQTRFVEVFR